MALVLSPPSASASGVSLSRGGLRVPGAFIGIFKRPKARLHSDSRRAFIRADRAAGWLRRLG